MYSTCPVHVVLLYLIIIVIMVRNTDLEARQYAVFCSFLLLPPT
jgi:hypothetical protein